MTARPLPHTEPNVHGMGAFEGGHLPGVLIEGRRTASATNALRELGDEAFARAVIEAIRTRPWWVAATILDGVRK